MEKTKLIKVGSERFRTEVMKDEECILFFGAALETNDGNAEEAFADMKMIDAMLKAERLHLALGNHVTRTSAGYLRKGSDLYSMYDGIVNARVAGAFNPER